MEALKPRPLEAVCLVLCAGLLLWQLFLPGFVGTANNGDYPKILGPMCIGGADNYANNFIYFQSDYVRDPKFCWDPHIPSSEQIVAWLAASFQHAVTGGAHFDIRWIAAIHSLVFLVFFYALLMLLRPLSLAPRALLSAVALWIFADTGTVTVFNSFWPDVLAILGGLAGAALAVHLLTPETVARGTLIAFGLAAILFVTSKTPHAVAGIVPLGFVVCLGFRSKARSVQWIAAGFALAMIAGMVWVLTTPPEWYLAQSRFDVVFYKIATVKSPAAAQDLRELGLGDSDLQYAGMNAYMSNSPMIDDKWAADFARRCTRGRVLSFYLHHPGTALAFLWSDLDAGKERRQANLSNFHRDDGQPANALSYRFALWSWLRSALFKLWPPHIVLWFVFALAGLPLLARRDSSRYRQAIVRTIAAVSTMAVAEYVVASLADATETHRHMMLFHILTDAAIFLALVYAVSRFDRLRAGSSSLVAHGAAKPLTADMSI